MTNEEFIYQLRVQLHRFMNANHGMSVIFSELNINEIPKPFATCKSYLTLDETDNYNEDIITLRDFNSYNKPPGEYRRRYVFQNINLSFNIYDKGDDDRGNIESQRLAGAMRNWFKIYSELLFEETNSVLLNMTNVQDRTTFIVDSYDYKSGFDVTIRRTLEEFFVPLHQTDDDGSFYDTIETVVVNDREITRRQ